MGYFTVPKSIEPIELINNIEANLKLYLDKLPVDADYKYLLDTFVSTDLRTLRYVLTNDIKGEDLICADIQ